MGSVFEATQKSEEVPQIQAPPPAQQSRSEDVDIMSIPLPSRGLLYPTQHPLYMKDEVDIKPMTAQEEDILTSRALIKNGTVIDRLLSACVSDRRVDVKSLLSGDRTALMVGIRVSGYGEEYDTELTCGSCEAKSKRQFLLSNLNIKRLQIEPIAPGVNAFRFKLPLSGKTVVFKFTTGHDEDEITKFGEKKKKLGGFDESLVTTKLLYNIISVDGDDKRDAVAKFVRSMRAMDSLKLREYIETNEPGIDMRQPTSCSACGAEEEVQMPIGVTFFWPTARR